MSDLISFTTSDNQKALFSEGTLKENSLVLIIHTPNSGPDIFIGKNRGGTWEGRILVCEDSAMGSLYFREQICRGLNGAGISAEADSLTAANCSLMGPGDDYSRAGERLIKFQGNDLGLHVAMEIISERLIERTDRYALPQEEVMAAVKKLMNSQLQIKGPSHDIH